VALSRDTEDGVKDFTIDEMLMTACVRLLAYPVDGCWSASTDGQLRTDVGIVSEMLTYKRQVDVNGFNTICLFFSHSAV
jgi:hypothetical protein